MFDIVSLVSQGDENLSKASRCLSCSAYSIVPDGGKKKKNPISNLNTYEYILLHN